MSALKIGEAFMKGTIADVQKGDVIRFTKHALRVEETPVVRGVRTMLSGRESREGCPYVQRWYFNNLVVQIERAAPPQGDTP